MSNLTHKKIRRRKHDDKDKKALCKLINSTVFGKTMENVRNRIGVRLVRQAI